MLTLTFLGVGCAFAKRNFQSNALVEAWTQSPDSQPAPDATLLIDFGATGPTALYQLKDRPGFEYLNRGGSIHYPALEQVFVTHLHNDHVGGLEELALSNRLAGGPGPASADRRPMIHGTPELLAALWENCLRGGLGVLGGRRATLQDYFRVQSMSPSVHGKPSSFRLADRYECFAFPTDHIRLAAKHDWPSFGLEIRDREAGESILYSGDTRFDPDGLGSQLRRAKLIFHDVQLEEAAEPVHPLLSELRTLPINVRRRMILYHYADSWDSPAYASVHHEFFGFAQPMHRYTLLD